jgi:glycolate oxidase
MDKNVYRKFESVLGPENVTQDPCLLDSYRYQWIMAEAGREIKSASRLLPHRAECVTLPSTTEEVQAIVKLCNRYNLRFKAHSTGWGAHGAPEDEGAVLIDLRRMNRLIEINEKDMYALVEPYVIWGQLQTEAMKKGLNCNAIGAGSGTSPMASCTSAYGAGNFNVSMGYNQRNVLGVEWVMPNGEVLRLGAPGSSGGWISGDGPGPSLRGLMRGVVGHMGGYGVFTKAAIRLYNWAGPSTMPSKDIFVSDERLIEYPKNLKVFVPSFEKLEDMQQAIAKIGEAEIADAIAIFGRSVILMGFTPSNKLVAEMLEHFAPQLPSHLFTLLLAGNTANELDYKVSVFEKILEATNGSKFDMIDDDKTLRHGLFLALVKGGNTPARPFSPAGSFNPSGSPLFPSFRRWVDMNQNVEKIKKKHCDTGLIVDDAGEGTWGPGIFDHGHGWYFENEIIYDHNVLESKEAVRNLQVDVLKWALSSKIPFFAEMTDKQRTIFTDPKATDAEINYNVKFKEAFNPNQTAENFYVADIHPRPKK